MIQICPLRKTLIECEQHALVTGGPGSGKTTLALMKGKRRIEAGLNAGQAILFLSFSRAAVTRIAETSKGVVPREVRSLIKMETFHSFFWSVLQAHAYLLGTPKKLAILLPHDERALSNGIEEGDLLWDAWIEQRKQLCFKEGRVAFDLFAPLAEDLLRKSCLIRQLTSKKFPLIIVDEAQDTNPHSWKCVELLSSTSQIICLADIEQQIFDHLPGVSPERIEDIKRILSPVTIDLGKENHRSPSTEIAAFGNAILNANPKTEPYKGVYRKGYNPRDIEQNRAVVLKGAIGMIQSCIEKTTGRRGDTIAVLFSTGASAARYSSALSAAEPPLRHKLLFDEVVAMLAARFAAFLLEPASSVTNDVVTSLNLLADMRKASGAAEALKLLGWAAKIRDGKLPKAALVKAIDQVVKKIKGERFSGDPMKDWNQIRRALFDANHERLSFVARQLDYIIAFNRGKRIVGSLSAIWQEEGAYVGARAALDQALAQDQLADGDDPCGVQLMTIHRAKGKQFDAVIVVREARYVDQEQISSFVWRGDEPPYYRSRKILHVAVTRARLATLILDPVWPTCPILSAFTF